MRYAFGVKFFPSALAVALLSVPAWAQGAKTNDEWQGPLPLENERPLQAIFLHLPAENPDVLPRGALRLGAQLDVANNLLIPAPGPNGETVTEDFETQRLKVTWRRGLGHGLEFGVGTNLTARDSGLIDAPIEWYHHLLGLAGKGKDDPAGRDNIPRWRSIFAFQNALGQGVNEGSALGLGDTKVWVKKQLTRGRFSSAARVALKVPTGSEGNLIGSGGFDGGAVVDARYKFAPKWAVYGSLGAAKYGNTSVPGARGSGLQAGLGFEWRVGKGESVILQSDAATRTVKTGNRIADRTPVIASIGYKKQVGQRGAYWISISENGDYQLYTVPLFGYVAPDFAFTIGYEWRK
jgi:hypothetical protein